MKWVATENGTENSQTFVSVRSNWWVGGWWGRANTFPVNARKVIPKGARNDPKNS